MIFVDTGALLARHLPSDQHHEAATAIWQQLASSSERLATTNLVIAEYLTLLARRTTPAFAAERGKALYGSDALAVLRPTEAEETQAILLMEKLGPSGVGFVDCVSFAIMQANSIRTAFTFDHHFVAAGFQVLPN